MGVTAISSWLLTWFLLFLVTFQWSEAKKRARPQIIEESGRSKPYRPTHCNFGNRTYELEDHWRPNLGPPFGELYCVHCECVAIHRKKRIAARARCRNIQTDCPAPDCDNPVLLPERCCKTCPGQDYADLEGDLALKRLEKDEDDNIREYSVLLTGRGAMPKVPIQGAARGYLTYNKRNLHYTFHVKGLPQITTVRFMNDEGTILEEQDVKETSSRGEGSNICGVWRNIPKVYRRLLQKDRLHIALSSDQVADPFVGGKVLRSIPKFNAEVFSALLLSDSTELLGVGGIALITPVQNSLQIVVDFNGIFTAKDSHNALASLNLYYRPTNDVNPTLIAETVITIPKANPDHNSGTGKIHLTPEIQTYLLEGKMELWLTTLEGGRNLKGSITLKPMCNVFQSLLVPNATHIQLPPMTAGFLLLNPNLDGSINYKLYITSTPSSFMLETTPPDGIESKILTKVQVSSNLDGWSNGTLPGNWAFIEALMSTDMDVTVELENGRGLLVGRLKQRLYTEAFANAIPILLVSDEERVAGMAWLSVDKLCILHYQLYVVGLESGRHLVEMLQVPESRYGRPHQQVLRKLDGDEAQDTTDIGMLTNQRGEQLYLLVTSKSGKGKYIELKGSITEVPLPAMCLTKTEIWKIGNNYNGVEEPYNDVYGIGVDTTLKCYYEGIAYSDGEQWKAAHDNCLMCSCQRGRVVCDKVLCPSLTCNNPISIQGECCPSCSEDVSLLTNLSDPARPRGCHFEGDRKFHMAGTSWHPYIPPFGFSQCALCTCDPTSLTIECKKRSCPPLPCADSVAFRDHALSCCKRCPNLMPVKSNAMSIGLSDQGSKKTPKDILLAGGCEFHGQVFPNGAEWSPTVEPFGEMKCINCYCKDGKARCRRKRCPKLSCPNKIQNPEDCCQRCSKDKGSQVRKDRRRRKEQAGD